MRIVAWNCRQGLKRKQLHLDELDADVYVISESSTAFVPPPGWSAVHRHEKHDKTLSVLARAPFSVVQADGDLDVECLLPVDVLKHGERVLTVLGLWTLTPGKGRPHYAAQAQRALTSWEEARSTAGGDPWKSVVVAGDFNASMQTASANKHVSTIAAMEARGLFSAYHQARGIQHGEEEDFTLRWVGPRSEAFWFHCDFAWISQDLLPHLVCAEVGSPADWIEAGVSDHAPLSLELSV